jgi:hypothetical protein
LSPDLFDAISTPGLWVTLAVPESGEHETRSLTVRVQEHGRRSISATVQVSRYAPEPSCLLACSKMVERIQRSQIVLSREVLADCLAMAVRDWVDPF